MVRGHGFQWPIVCSKVGALGKVISGDLEMIILELNKALRRHLDVWFCWLLTSSAYFKFSREPSVSGEDLNFYSENTVETFM